VSSAARENKKSRLSSGFDIKTSSRFSLREQKSSVYFVTFHQLSCCVELMLYTSRNIKYHSTSQRSITKRIKIIPLLFSTLFFLQLLSSLFSSFVATFFSSFSSSFERKREMCCAKSIESTLEARRNALFALCYF
jgi:hypothetical protein